jgi:hypothetical protein
MNNEIMERLLLVEKRYLRLKTVMISSSVLLMISFISLSFADNRSTGEIIRTKGIIIEDSAGRDRILIGSPIPYSKDRVRTDTALVRKYWASKFRNPDQYMGWYKDYSNTADGIVVMNEKGFDIVQVGDKLSDANVGKRMFASSGILWNTQTGWERGGAGVNTTADGKSRPTIGLDDDSGEALHLICLEDGSKGIFIARGNESIRIGLGKANGDLFESKTAFAGIQYFDSTGKLLWEQKLDKKK